MNTIRTIKDIVSICRSAIPKGLPTIEQIEHLTSIFKADGWKLDGGMYKRVFIRGRFVVKVGDLRQDVRIYRHFRLAGEKRLCPRLYYSSIGVMVQQRVSFVGDTQMSDFQLETLHCAKERVQQKQRVRVADMGCRNVGVLGNKPKVIDGLCSKVDRVGDNLLDTSWHKQNDIGAASGGHGGCSIHTKSAKKWRRKELRA